MIAKLFAIFVLAIASSNAGVLPLAAAPAALVAPAPVATAAYAVAPYASSYSAHAINHAVATPVVAPAAPFVAPAPYVASAPYVAAAPAAPVFSARYFSSPYFL